MLFFSHFVHPLGLGEFLEEPPCGFPWQQVDVFAVFVSTPDVIFFAALVGRLFKKVPIEDAVGQYRFNNAVGKPSTLPVGHCKPIHGWIVGASLQKTTRSFERLPADCQS
jgi:hypothetical protein